MFSSSANGNVAPTRVSTAANTCALNNSSQMALDQTGNFYVSCTVTAGTEILEFASSASTPEEPSKTIVGSATGLETVLALDIDKAGNLYVLNYIQSAGLFIEVYGAAGSGNIAPAVHISSGQMTSIFPQLALR